MVDKNSLCSVCSKEGMFVKNITVKHMILSNLKETVGNTDYFLCMNENCHVSYFNNEFNIKFNKDDITEPIWFKSNAIPKYSCYCNRVTEEQIIDAVISKGAKNMKDIIVLTGAMKNGKCETNNPSGKCCSAVIQEAIEKGLQVKETLNK